MRARILGIESSCDETAAAVVEDGRKILSSIVASQVDIHRNYGGVVPELASREHLRSIVPVVREALQRAGLGFDDLDGIGVTCGPGLVGALLVGLTYGKVLALTLGKPLIAVNHLEGHVRAVFLEAYAAGLEPQLPAVCLIVSGGHTVLYEVTADGPGDAKHPQPTAETMFGYRRIGQTRDDAAGEAYDKVARLLALGYPGGPVVDQLAAQADEDHGGIRFKPIKLKGNPYDFSFSGLKTAVLYYLRAHPELEPEIEVRRQALAHGERKAAQLLPLTSAHTLNLLGAFQRTVVSELVGRTFNAAKETGARSVLVSGGVAANGELRATFQREAELREPELRESELREAAAHESEGAGEAGVKVYFPSRALSTDNAAMIAAAAYPRLLAGELADSALNAEAVMPLA